MSLLLKKLKLDETSERDLPLGSSGSISAQPGSGAQKMVRPKVLYTCLILLAIAGGLSLLPHNKVASRALAASVASPELVQTPKSSLPQAEAGESVELVENQRAIELFNEKKYQESLAQLVTLIKANPNTSFLYVNAGMAALRLGEFTRSREYFLKAIQTNSGSDEMASNISSRAYNNLGSLSLEEKKIDEALGFFQKAVLINNDLMDGHLNLAKAFELAGRFPEAILEYEVYLGSAAKDLSLSQTISDRVSKLKAMLPFLRNGKEE